jgi:hypothetical protein
MKKTLTLLAFFGCLILNAQSPQFINYQAILRDAAGIPIAAGTTVNLNVKIFNDPSTSSLAYEENHNNIAIPLGNVINIKIGKGIGVPPNTNFSAVQWNQGTVEYIISLNGTPLGVRDRFASVPFALNAGGASTNYSPSANISTTGNILDLTDKLTNSVSVGSNQNPVSKIPMLSMDQKGRVIGAAEYAANINGDIAGRLDSQMVIKLKGVPLSSVAPSPGQVLQFNGSNWGPSLLTGSGPWTYTNGTIYPSNSALNDKVAIGSGTATSMLDVRNSATSAFTSGPVANFVNTNVGLNPGSGMVQISHQSGNGSALYVQNMNSAAGSDGVIVNMSNNANGNDGLRVTHVGLGRAGNFINTNGSTTVEALGASISGNQPAIRGINLASGSNSLAIGIHGKTQNQHQNSAGVFGENIGNGSGVVGTTSANVAGVVGINLSNSIQANGLGVYGLSNSSSSVAAGVFGESKGNGYGVFGINTNTVGNTLSGVYGTTTGTTITNSGVTGETGGAANGVKGVNKGTGNSVLGSKPSGVTSGFAGRFEINDPANSSAALFAITQGQGAAVQAVAGSPSLSALSVHMQNGHIKSSGSNIATVVGNITTNVVGSYTVAFAPICSNCNDTRGEVFFFAQTTTALINGNYAEITIPFSKAYGAPPIVVVTPTNDHLGLHHMVTNVSASSFSIRIYRPVGQTFPTTISAGTSFNFTYNVME